MGTSSNQRSPDRPTWRLPQALIGRQDVALEHQSAELWRAASSDPQTNIVDRLSDPILARTCSLADTPSSPAAAMAAFDGLLQQSHAAGFILDLSRRALVRSVAAGSGSAGFVKELFAEVVGYYASRDLPSYVGKSQRIGTSSELIALKRGLQDHVRTVVAAEQLPDITNRTWRALVGRITKALTSAQKP
jgi:hypothetical protein